MLRFFVKRQVRPIHAGVTATSIEILYADMPDLEKLLTVSYGPSAHGFGEIVTVQILPNSRADKS